MATYDIKMDDFSAIKVSTQTFIIRSNLAKVKPTSLSDAQEVIVLDTAYEDISDDEDEDGIEFPRIITVSYKKLSRGKPQKKKKKATSSGNKNFLNCVSFTVQTDPKKTINVKLFGNGVFQLTGCKCYDHAKQALIAVWKAIKPTNLFQFKTDTGFSDKRMEAYVVSAMRNVDFRLGFEVDREALQEYIFNNTAYKTVPIIQGFMGVQISVPIQSIDDMIVHKLTFDDDECSDATVTYAKFLEVKPKTTKQKKEGKAVTVSVFQTGKVLISGVDETFQEPVFKWFINLMKDIQHIVAVKKQVPKTFVEYLPKKRRSKFQCQTVFG